MLKVKSYLISILLLILLSCIGADRSKSYSSEFILMGSLLNKTDQASGVSQASPGANSGGNGFTGFFGGSSSVSDGKTAIRFKVYDDPISQPKSNGILNLYAEYENIDSLFDGNASIPPAEVIKLSVSRIEITNANSPTTPILIKPNNKESRIEIRKWNHFIPFAMGVSLHSGTYTNIKVFLNPTGSIYFNNKEYVLNLVNTIVTFSNPFDIQNGKATSLKIIPRIEADSSFIINKGNYVKKDFDIIKFIDYAYEKNTKNQFNISLNFTSSGQITHTPLQKLNIMFSQITAIDKTNNSFTLNNTPTIFEILSLSNGFVGLATHDEVPANEYTFFEIMLGRMNTIIDSDGNNLPLIMDDRSQNIFRFEGSFMAQNKRTMEFYMHINPNKSVFYVPNRGYILDPYLELDSFLSMTEDQYSILVNRLNKRINLVGRDSECVIVGSVSDIGTTLATNVNNQQMIYTNVTIQIKDILRGNLDQDNISLRVIGGSYKGKKLEVLDMPKFKLNESLILFLKKNGDSFYITRGQVGKVNL